MTLAEPGEERYERGLRFCADGGAACEIGMTPSTSLPYASFLHLVEEATRTAP